MLTRSTIAPLQRSNTLLQLSRSSIFDLHLAPRVRAIHYGTFLTCRDGTNSINLRCAAISIPIAAEIGSTSATRSTRIWQPHCELADFRHLLPIGYRAITAPAAPEHPWCELRRIPVDSGGHRQTMATCSRYLIRSLGWSGKPPIVCRRKSGASFLSVWLHGCAFVAVALSIAISTTRCAWHCGD